MSYSDAGRQFELEAGASGPVRAMLAEDQWVVAERGVSVDQEGGLATLRGPGTVEYRGAEVEDAVEIRYTDQLQLKFVARAGAGESLGPAAREDVEVEWIELAGPVALKAGENELEAREGEVDVLSEG